MGTEVGNLYYDLDIDDKKLQSGLDNADKSVKSFGDKAQGAFRDTAKVLAVVSAGLTVFSKSATDFTVDYVKSAKSLGAQIGVTTTEASRLVAAFGRMGIEATAAAQMFGIFSKKIVESTTANKDNQLAVEKLQIDIEKTKASIAATTAEIQKHGDKSGELSIKLKELNNTLASEQNALSKSADSFQKLGISTVDAQGKQKDFNTLLFEVADKFKTMPNGIDKTAIALDLFGRSGKDMIKVLNLGSAGIQDLEKQADKLGLTLNPTTIAAVEKLVESQKNLKQQTDALKIAVGTATAPVLTAFNEKINEIIKSLMNAQEPLHGLAVNALAFGGPIAGATSGIAAFLGNISSIGPAVARVAAGLGIFLVVAAALAGIGYLMYQNWQTVGPVLAQLGGQIYAILAPAIAFLTMAWGWLSAAMSLVWAMLVSYLAPAFDQLWGAIQRLWAAVNPAFTDALKILGAIMAGVVVAAIFALIGALIAIIAAASFVVSAISNIINWLSNFIGWLGNAAVSTAHAVATIGQFFLYLPLAVAGAIGSAISWVASLPGRAIGAVGNLGGALYGAGQALVQGFINGIGSMFGSLFGKLHSMASSAVNEAKRILGIHSPSRVFMGIGKNVTAGFVQGITDTAGLATAAISDLANNVIAPTVSIGAKGLGGAPGGGSSTRYGDTYVQIGEVNNSSDENYILNRINQNWHIERDGGSPAMAGGF